MAEVLPNRTNASASLILPTRVMLDAKAVAQMFAVSLRTVRHWDAAGMMPEPVRIGSAVRWRADEISAWSEAGCPGREKWSALRKSRKLKIRFS